MQIFMPREGSIWSKDWKNYEISFKALVEVLEKPHVDSHTQAQFLKLSQTDQTAIKNTHPKGGFVLGTGKDGHSRTKDAVLSRSGLAYDFDLVPDGLLDQLEQCEYNYVLYSTCKSTPEVPRYRVIFPLASEIKTESYEAVMRAFADKMGWLDSLGKGDPSTYQASRAMFFPVVLADQKDNYVCRAQTEKKNLNAFTEIIQGYFLAKGLNPAESGTWPRSEKEAKKVPPRGKRRGRKGRGLKPTLQWPDKPLHEGEGRNNAVLAFFGQAVRDINPDDPECEEIAWKKLKELNKKLCAAGEELSDEELKSTIWKTAHKWTWGENLKKKDHQAGEAAFKPRMNPPKRPLDGTQMQAGEIHMDPLCFPEEIRDFLLDAAKAYNVPFEMVACFALGAVNSTISHRYIVKVRQTWEEPVELFLIVTAKPGSRKSVAWKLAWKPIDKAANKFNDARKRDRADWRAQYDRAKFERKDYIRMRQKKGGEQYDPKKAAELQARVTELEDHPVKKYVAYISNATPEATRNTLIANNGVLAFSSDEPSVFQGLKKYAGNKNDTVDLTLYNDGYDEIQYTNSRVSGKFDTAADEEGNYILKRPSLSICFACQPDLLDDLFDPGRNRDMTASGFLQRGLFAWCVRPDFREAPDDPETEVMGIANQQFYETLIGDLFAPPTEKDTDPEIIKMDFETHRDVFKPWEKEINLLSRTQEDHFLEEWLCKCTGKTVRLALTLQACKGPIDPGTPLDRECMENAISLMRDYFWPQVQAYFMKDTTLDHAKFILGKKDTLIKKQQQHDGSDIIYVGDVKTVTGKHGTMTARECLEALDLLEAKGWITVNEDDISVFTGEPRYIRFT